MSRRPSTGWPCACSGEMYGGGAEDRRRLRRGLWSCDDARDAEVHHLDLALARDHDVRGLDVPMDRRPATCAYASASQIFSATSTVCGSVKRPPALMTAVEGPSLDELHDDELRLAVGAESKMPTRLGWFEARRRLRLAAEAVDELGVAGELREQHLDRDGAVEHGVHAAIDLAHAARADPGLHPVPAPEHRPFNARPPWARQERLEDLTGDRRGHLASGRLAPEVAAVQDDNRDRDRGDLARSRRREADEPRVGRRSGPPCWAVPVLPAITVPAIVLRCRSRSPRRSPSSRACRSRSSPRSAARTAPGRTPGRASLWVADLGHQPGRHHHAAGSRWRTPTAPSATGWPGSLSCPIAEMATSGSFPLEVARVREPSGRERHRERDRRLQAPVSIGGSVGQKPYACDCSESTSGPSCRPTSPKITLHEFVNAVSSVVVAPPPGRSRRRSSGSCRR